MKKKLVVVCCPDEGLEHRFYEMIEKACYVHGLDKPLFIDSDNEIKRLIKLGIYCLIYISPGTCRKPVNMLFPNLMRVKRKLVITGLNHKPIKIIFFNWFGSSIILTDHQSDEDLCRYVKEALDPKLGAALYQNPLGKGILDFFDVMQSNYLRKFDCIMTILLYMRSNNISPKKISRKNASCGFLYKNDELISVEDAAVYSEMYNRIFFRSFKIDRMYRSRFPLLAEE